ncbi:MAG: type II toxin-antitoxin system RelB/DinJ family antitoxin [Caldilineaceae bacterium]|nr:type II toxin-antitoxin system RelB/DinJ family antitoxin [Caldilineaceae bacterium]
MSKTATISVRVDEELKSEAEQVFGLLGLTSSQAITIFYRQVALQRGLPFAVRLPQIPKASAIAEAVRGKYAALPTSSTEFAHRKVQEIALEQ